MNRHPSLQSPIGPVLQIQNVTKVYPNLRRALDRLSLEIGPGVFGLLGPNGAGKSTLMAILTGGLEFEEGSVRLNGVDLGRDPSGWRRQLGYMPQTFDFVPHVTGREYLEQSALLSGYSPRGLRGRIDDLLGRVHLVDAQKRAAITYSRGMKQRLAVAATILCEPSLILLDEPTSGLDPEERVFFRELLVAIPRDRLVILSTHIVADVERCCAQIGIVAGGRLLYQGTPSELVSRVAGRVWESPVDEGQIDQLEHSRRLLGLRDQAGGAIARLVGESAPSPQAVSVAPNLEDAYMHLIANTMSEAST